MDGGESRIRTCEGMHQQIYSLPPLATWVSPRQFEAVENSPSPGSVKVANRKAWLHGAGDMAMTVVAQLAAPHATS